MDLVVRPDIATSSTLATVISFAILALGIYLFFRLLWAVKDIRAIRKDTRKMLELLEEEKKEEKKNRGEGDKFQ